jgi:lipopolysaccharide transport system ATP-binding protein
MSLAIQFERVSKLYRLGEVGTGTISRDLERAWAKFRGRPDPYAKLGTVNDPAVSGGETVWALRDLSFEVSQGVVFGIIGRNGAGKSTLLKLLSRVTSPTDGFIRTRGKIASLLEVGTGFHPELTGRENIFLNGAILGMSRRETKDRLDEIIEFSGCAKYLDTPVKRYSSGMTVRLGFSVAAHLSCDTLIVDEVLAVGDIDFQQRCIEKMQTVARSGRTILLVSHNMSTVARLCNQCMILEQGKIEYCGSTSTAIGLYLKKQSELPSVIELSNRAGRSGSGRARFQRFWIENEARSVCQSCCSGETLYFCFSLVRGPEPVNHMDVQFSIHELNGDLLVGFCSSVSGTEFSVVQEQITVRCRIDRIPLPVGQYTVAVRTVSRGEELDWPDGFVAGFEVFEGDFYGTGRRLPIENPKFLLSGHWTTGDQ